MVLLDALQERRLVRWPIVTGMIVGFAGTALLLRPAPGNNIDVRGAIFVLAAGVLWAVGSIYSRTAPQAPPPLRAIGMNMLAGGAALTVLGVAGGELPEVRWSGAGLLAILWLSTIGSLVGFSAYLYALRLLPAATVSTYAFVNPIVAVLLGWLVLHEQVTAQTLVAMAVTVVGVALIVVSRARLTQSRKPA
jgi:drug/metabolite transporter (DMT)-like permease